MTWSKYVFFFYLQFWWANAEEDNMKTEGKKSLQDAARTDDDKGQNHKVLASEDINVNEKETGLASINLEEVAELHHDNQKQDEKG